MNLQEEKRNFNASADHLANISLVFGVVKSNEDPGVKGHRASRMLAGTTMPAGMTDLMQESDYVQADTIL